QTDLIWIEDRRNWTFWLAKSRVWGKPRMQPALAVLIVAEHLMPKARVELRANVVSAVVKQAQTPALEHLAWIAVARGIVGRRNPRLKKLPNHLRRIERQSAGVPLCYKRAGSRVGHARPDGTMLLSEVSRIGL